MHIFFLFIFYFIISPLSIIRKLTFVLKPKKFQKTNWEDDLKKDYSQIFSSTESNPSNIKNFKEIKGDTDPNNYTFW